MDFFNDVLNTFLGFGRGRTLAIYARVREISDFIKYFLICVLKINEGLAGLEQH